MVNQAPADLNVALSTLAQAIQLLTQNQQALQAKFTTTAQAIQGLTPNINAMAKNMQQQEQQPGSKQQ